MSFSLSLLCVTTGKPRAVPFLNHFEQVGRRLGAEVVVAVDGKDVHSKGYLESCLSDAIDLCKGDWVLRMDDDEKLSPAMIEWLSLIEWDTAGPDTYSFPRVHFWGDANTVIADMYYFPDLQTRLTRREVAKRPDRLHAGCPQGAGTITRVCIEHWAYLVKDKPERLAIAESYHRIQHGADGGMFRASSFEDEKNGDHVTFMEYNGGSVPMKGRMWRGTCEHWKRPAYQVQVGR